MDPKSTSVPPLGVRGAVLGASALTVTLAMIAPALPHILAHYASQPGAPILVRLALTAPALTIAILALPIGIAIDRLPKRAAIGAAALAFGVIGASGALIDSLELLLASRILLGIAAAFMICGTSSLTGDLFPVERRAGFIGVQNSSNFALGIGFMLATGALVDIDWRLAFLPYLVALPIAAMAFHHLPPAGSGGEHTMPSVPTGPGAWGMIAFMLGLTALAMVFFNLGATQTPFLLARLHSGSAFHVGLALSSATIAGFPVAFFYGRIVRVFGTAPMFLLGFALTGAGLMIQGGAVNLETAILGMMVSGMGFGAIMPNLGAPLITLAPPAMRGRISGAMLSAVFLGQFASPLVSQPMVESIGLQPSFTAFGAAAILIGVATRLFLQFKPLA